MYKHLYDKFADWFHNDRGSVYFYSDPHFNDKEQASLRKNYIGDEEQIKRINSKIGKYDTLVILGDVGDIEWVRKIRGYKVLIMGNHDKGATNYKRTKYSYVYREEEYTYEQLLLEMKNNFPHHNISIKLEDFPENNFWIVEIDNGLFDEVYEGALMIAPNIILSHEPIDFPYVVCFSGHNHANNNLNPNIINFCAEHINYTPVALKDIINSGVLNKVPNIHRETIDNAIERKEKRKKG